MDILKCEDCGNAQLTHVIDATEVYLNYTYETASTLGLGGHFEESANSLFELFSPNQNGLAIDIGSNDGTFLSVFNKSFKLYGCDPTIKKFSKYYRKDINQLPFFFSSKLFKNKKFDLVTSISMFYDLPDPNKFLRDVKKVLK